MKVDIKKIFCDDENHKYIEENYPEILDLYDKLMDSDKPMILDKESDSKSYTIDDLVIALKTVNLLIDVFNLDYK